jgi:hypothetical protein
MQGILGPIVVFLLMPYGTRAIFKGAKLSTRKPFLTGRTSSSQELLEREHQPCCEAGREQKLWNQRSALSPAVWPTDCLLWSK